MALPDVFAADEFKSNSHSRVLEGSEAFGRSKRPKMNDWVNTVGNAGRQAGDMVAI